MKKIAKKEETWEEWSMRILRKLFIEKVNALEKKGKDQVPDSTTPTKS